MPSLLRLFEPVRHDINFGLEFQYLAPLHSRHGRVGVALRSMAGGTGSKTAAGAERYTWRIPKKAKHTDAQQHDGCSDHGADDSHRGVAACREISHLGFDGVALRVVCRVVIVDYSEEDALRREPVQAECCTREWETVFVWKLKPGCGPL